MTKTVLFHGNVNGLAAVGRVVARETGTSAQKHFILGCTWPCVAARLRSTCLRLSLGVMAAVRCRGLDRLKHVVVGDAGQSGLIGFEEPPARQARCSTGLKLDLQTNYSHPTYNYHRYHPFISCGEEQKRASKLLLQLDVCIHWCTCMQCGLHRDDREALYASVPDGLDKVPVPIQ